MKVEDCIFFQLAKASRAGSGFWAKKVKHLGVTASQAMVLNFLGEEDCVPSHILSRKLQITSATMTGILDRLEKMDLIERRPHHDDRRAILVCLSSQGLTHAKEINTIMITANDAFLSELGPDQSQKFREFLKHVWMERS
ncbi:MAG: MarR family transcriptional regulator [Thermodesulfobacteriota bacterium]